MTSAGFTSLRIHRKVIIFAIGWVLLSSGWPAFAAESEQILKVGISPFSPFVMLSEDGPRGCSIDYWKKLAELLKTRYEFVECTGVADKLKRLANGEIDIAIGGITITEERETQFDFTQPTFRSGLDILIRADRHPGIVSLVASLFEKITCQVKVALFTRRFKKSRKTQFYLLMTWYTRFFFIAKTLINMVSHTHHYF